MPYRILTTSDGSHTIFNDAVGESYHSQNGSITESLHVFIYSGIAKVEKNNIRVLEIGFGTGLNALLTALWAKKSQKLVDYTAVEPFPLEDSLVSTLNYTTLINDPQAALLFRLLHNAPCEAKAGITENFTLLKLHDRLEKLDLERGVFDCVYFDAFSPQVQPELWNLQVFASLFDSLCAGGILVTYSAKGLVRRTMTGAGFKVERLPGPPGKREMLRAKKPA